MNDSWAKTRFRKPVVISNARFCFGVAEREKGAGVSMVLKDIVGAADGQWASAWNAKDFHGVKDIVG